MIVVKTIATIIVLRLKATIILISSFNYTEPNLFKIVVNTKEQINK